VSTAREAGPHGPALGPPPWINETIQQRVEWRDGDIVISVPAEPSSPTQKRGTGCTTEEWCRLEISARRGAVVVPSVAKDHDSTTTKPSAS
jgi:hypothetical protein